MQPAPKKRHSVFDPWMCADPTHSSCYCLAGTLRKDPYCVWRWKVELVIAGTRPGVSNVPEEPNILPKGWGY